MITVPADLTVPATGATGPIATVTCTATDKAANPASKTFKVTVSDTTAPVITVPADMTVSPKSASGAPVTFAATATDTVDPSVAVSCVPASGSTFPVGATTVPCTAIDKAGNRATKSFKVTVSTPTAPTVTVPPDRSVGAESAAGDLVTYAVTATDALDATVPVTCTPASGSTFPIGLTTVTCTATNSAGKTSTKSFGVTVQPPVSDQYGGDQVGPDGLEPGDRPTDVRAGPDTTTKSRAVVFTG